MTTPRRDQIHRIAAHQSLDQGHLPVGWMIDKGTKSAVSMKGKHYRDYSITHAEIDRWNWRWQQGWAMCEPSQDWTMDFDGGARRMEQFHAEYLVPRTAIQRTGRPGGGWHLVFKGSGDQPWPRDGVWSADWLDVQVRSNGFIAVTPSVHPSGTPYQWVDDHPQAGPGPLLLASRPEREPRHRGGGGGPGREGGPDGDLAYYAEHGIPVGWQDTEIHRLACANVRSMSEHDLFGWLMACADRSVQNLANPWRPEDVMAKIRRAAEFVTRSDASALRAYDAWLAAMGGAL